jgi:hypothetical protein
MDKIFERFAVCYEQTRASLRPRRAATPCGWGLGPALGLLALLLTACFGPDAPSSQDTVLIRCDQRTVTRAQFDRAFEAARIAYSDDRSVDDRVIAAARLRLLNQMSEEVIIDRRAQELGVVLDETEVEAAIAAIKADYPPGEFEQMLLESAISFALWKDRLQARLLMQKVVDMDLDQTQDISPREIQAYYRDHEAEFAVDDQAAPQADLTRHIVERLRRQKVEKRYPHWMAELRERYQLTINWEQWDQFQPAGTESASRPEEDAP